DDHFDTGRDELVVDVRPGPGHHGVLGLGDDHHHAERRHGQRPYDPPVVVVALDDSGEGTLDPDPVTAHDRVHPLAGRVEHGDPERLGELVAQLEDVPGLDRGQQFQRVPAPDARFSRADLAQVEPGPRGDVTVHVNAAQVHVVD